MKGRMAVLALAAALLCAVAAAGTIRDRMKDQRVVRKYHIKYKDFNGTPNNTVIFYGGFHGTGNDFIFNQVDPDHEPERQAVAGEEFFVSKPVRFGSRYILEYWYWTDAAENYEGFSTSRSYGEEDSPVVIDVPYEPGFYYFGYYDGRPSITSGSLVEWDLHPPVEMKPAALRKMLGCYRGTDWEPLIREELKAAEAEAKQYKAMRRAAKRKQKD